MPPLTSPQPIGYHARLDSCPEPAMPPAYRRMLMILAIFLASMMLIGRIDFGLSDEPVVPPHVQAMMEHQKAQITDCP